MEPEWSSKSTPWALIWLLAPLGVLINKPFSCDWDNLMCLRSMLMRRHRQTHEDPPWGCKFCHLGNTMQIHKWYCGSCLVTQSCLTLCDPMDCIAHQASLSMEFSRQEYWSGLPFPSPGHVPDPGIEPLSPVLAGRFFITEPPGKSNNDITTF